MRKSLMAAGVAGSVLAATIAAPAFADSHTADLSVLHGIPGLTVDVYVNGANTLDDFAPGDLAGPLSLPAGDYVVAITADDAADDSAPILGPVTLTLAAGMNYTAVAHLDAAGAPTVSFFTNDISPTAAGEGRVTVRHTAAAPAVDVFANGGVLFSNLTNPNEVMGDVPADTYEVAVGATGTPVSAAVLGPIPLVVPAGENTVVYAWGSLADDNLTVAVQSINVGAGSPAGIPSGTEGLAATGSNTTGLIVAMLLALAAVGVTARVVTARR